MNEESRNKISFNLFKNSYFINNKQINLIINIQHKLKLKKELKKNVIKIKDKMKKSKLSLIFYNSLIQILLICIIGLRDLRYIHLDGKTKNDIDNGKEIIHSNIKYCKHLYKSRRFSFEMVKVMFELLNKARKLEKYNYYHFFSDSCYLVKSLNDFYKFFKGNNSYLSYGLNKLSFYRNQSYALYWGSQWMTLHKDIVNKLLNYKYLLTKYEKEINNGTIAIRAGAYDEHIIQNIIISDICNGNPKKYNVENRDIRYIRWKNCSKKYCPNYLNINNVNEEEINKIKNNFLIIRKIDYKDSKSLELLKLLRGF